MSFDDLKAYGTGTLRYRLEVEGWPVEWVSSPSITHASGKDGRLVLEGLQEAGLAITERIVMHECALEVGGMQFKVTPPYPYFQGLQQWDDAIKWLAREIDPVETLASALTYNGTTIAFTSGTTYPTGTVFHIGTEAVRVTTWPTITRHIWNSQPQAHPLTLYGIPKPAVYVYTDLPPTMEGRRVFLYAYGDGDDPAGDGTVIWRGMVADVPSLATDEDDGTSWVIDCDSITQSLNQNVAAKTLEAKLVGIYHHCQAPFVFTVMYGNGDFGDPDITFGPYFYSGWDANEAAMISSINGMMQSVVFTTAAAGSYIASIELKKTDEGYIVEILRTSDVPFVEPAFHVWGGSPILGYFYTSADNNWKVYQKAENDFGPGLFGVIHPPLEALAADSSYFTPLYSLQASGYYPFEFSDAPVSPLGDASIILRGRLGAYDFVGGKFSDPHTSSITNYPPWRLYVDRDMAGALAVYISGTRLPTGVYTVASTGLSGSVYYIDLNPVEIPAPQLLGSIAVQAALVGSAAHNFAGFVGGDTEIFAVRSYGVGSVTQLIAGIKLAGRDSANAGDTPFLTDSDLTDFALVVPPIGLALLRAYMFAERLRVGDVLREELKFTAHFMRLETDGRIGIAPLPSWSDGTLVDDTHEIDGDDILTPHGGQGAWPTCTPNRDGRPTMVTVQDQYVPFKKEWIDSAVEVQEEQSIAVTKGRGKAEMAIKPYSQTLLDEGLLARDQKAQLGLRWLSFFSKNYNVTKILVPYTKWDVLCGDIVSITSEHVIGGDGLKGVTGRRGVVIERKINLDFAVPGPIELAVMLTPRSVVGYAPAGRVTSWSNVSGDRWQLELFSEEQLNVAMSSAGDGKVCRGFEIGDYVRVFEVDDYTPTEVLGTVSSVDYDNDHVTVDFDSSWSPGDPEIYGGNWILEFQVDDGSTATAHERQYAYVCDAATQRLPDGSFGRRLA